MFTKIMVISFFVAFVGITTWLFVESLTADKFPLGNILPSFTYRDTTGVKIIDKSHAGKIVVVIFSTDCHFCKDLMTDLDKNISQFKNVKFYLLAKEDNLFNAIKSNKFKNITSLLKTKYVYFGSINSKTAEAGFGTAATPAIFVFDANNKLIKKITGSVSVLNILD
jgi:thiol-disulfide isomerase/thioredoxin